MPDTHETTDVEHPTHMPPVASSVRPTTHPGCSLELVVFDPANPDNQEQMSCNQRPTGSTNPVVDDAFEELVQRVRPRMVRYLCKRRVPIEDAEEMIQEALLAYWKKMDSIHKPDHWVMAALANEYRMYCRTRGRRFVLAVEDTILQLLDPGSAPTQEQAVLRGNIKRLVGTLKYQCRQFVEMRFGLGFDARETAEALGYKRSSIDKIGKRCLDQLAHKLEVAAHGLMRWEEA